MTASTVAGENTVLHKANFYIYSVVGIGLAVLLEGLYSWHCPDLNRFLVYLALATVAAMLKVRLPGMTGTFSLSFLFVLMSVVDLTFPETLVLGAVSTLAQCLWRTKVRATLAQIMFNVANSMITIAVCCLAVQSGVSQILRENVAAELAVITCIYFAVNTLLVSGVISLLDGQPLMSVWRRWFIWSFPYYLVGSAVAGIVTVASRTSGWQSSLFIVSVMVLVYTYYRTYIARQAGTL